MTKRELIEILKRLSSSYVKVSFRYTFTLPGGSKISVDDVGGKVNNDTLNKIDEALLAAGYPTEFVEAALRPKEAKTPLLSHLADMFAKTEGKLTVEDAKRMISDFTGSSFDRVIVDSEPMRKLKPYVREVANRLLAEDGIPKGVANGIVKKLMTAVTAGVINQKRPFSLIGVKSVKLSPDAKRGKWLFHDNEESRDSLNKWIAYHVKRMLKESEWEDKERMDVMTALAKICESMKVEVAKVLTINDDGKVNFPETIIKIAEEAEER